MEDGCSGANRRVHSAHPNIPTAGASGLTNQWTGSLTAALTTEEKGAFLGLGCWEAVGGRWHPQLPEAEGELGLRQALRLPTERAEVDLQRKGREACGCPTLAVFCTPLREGFLICLWLEAAVIPGSS